MNPPAHTDETDDEAIRTEIQALLPTLVARSPANASSIVLTTITDVSTLAVFLGLATWLV